VSASSSQCEKIAAMTERSLVDVAESAGDELALRLRIPCDIVDVHRISESRKRIFSSLRYGAFLLTYAPLEGFFTQLTGYAARTDGRALPLNLDKIQRELALRWPEAGFQVNLWEGRTRQQPTVAGRRSEWALLKGRRLKDYLSDMKMLRDLLSHGGDPLSVTNDGRTLWKVGRGWSMRLMGVEGFIQFTEDLAEQALLEAGLPLARFPIWPEPQRSGISLSGRPALPNRDCIAARQTSLNR
jgi:hypothetical protein